MSSPIPPWLQTPRGLLMAAALLLTLLVVVPGVIDVSRSRTRAASPPGAGAAPGSDLPPEAAGDPFGPPADDWLSAEIPGGAAEGLELDRQDAIDCLVQPSRIVEIGSQIVGLIEAVLVEPGDRVEAGQAVVELEAGVERAAVEVARMRATAEGALRAREEALALSTSRRERGTELYQKKALSAEDRQELETQARIAALEVMQAEEARQLASLELRQAEARLARRTLRAPISGVVVERLLEPGEVVDEETILKIARIDPLRVDVLMPAGRYGAVKPGMRAAIDPEYPVDASVVATVSVVDPIIDAASGTFGVQMELPNPDAAIPGGLHCTVKFLDE